MRFPFAVDLQTRRQARSCDARRAWSGLPALNSASMKTVIIFFTSYLRWMDVNLFAASERTRPNFFPGEGLTPFLANFRDAQVSLTFRPT